MLVEGGLTKANYSNNFIPLAAGLVFLFSTLITIGLGMTLMILPWSDGLIVLFLLIVLGLLGLIDDFLGSRSDSGFHGHFSKLLAKKQLTTGALKALMGGLSALLVSFLITPSSLLIIVLNGALIALTINAFNLLDLRPGRAIKFFILAVTTFLIFFWQRSSTLLLAPFLGAVLAYFPLDLKAEAMMGDTGSNLLGGVLGLVLAWNLSFSSKVIVLFLLVIFHLYTEKHSLTETIARINWLRYLDELGRKGEKRNG